MSDESAIDITVRLPRPGEDRAAYEAYLDGLFAPVRAEMDRLRAGLVAGDDESPGSERDTELPACQRNGDDPGEDDQP